MSSFWPSVRIMGVSLFRMMPDGHLVFTEAFNDDMGGSLNTPSTITASIQNGVLHAFIGTQHTSAMVHLQAGHANLGQVASSFQQWRRPSDRGQWRRHSDGVL